MFQCPHLFFFDPDYSCDDFVQPRLPLLRLPLLLLPLLPPLVVSILHSPRSRTDVQVLVQSFTIVRFFCVVHVLFGTIAIGAWLLAVSVLLGRAVS